MPIQEVAGMPHFPRRAYILENTLSGRGHVVGKSFSRNTRRAAYVTPHGHGVMW